MLSAFMITETVFDSPAGIEMPCHEKDSAASTPETLKEEVWSQG
jgi:hypothetical protein